MSEVELKLGDVVYLKSGGVAMTVTCVGENNLISCAGQASDGRPFECVFNSAALTIRRPRKR